MFDVGQPLLSPPCPPAPPNQSLSNERQVGGYLGHLGSRHAPCWATLPLSCVKGKASSKTKLWRLPKCHNPIFLCFRSLTCVDRRGGGGVRVRGGACRQQPRPDLPRLRGAPQPALAGLSGGCARGGEKKRGGRRKTTAWVSISRHTPRPAARHTLSLTHTLHITTELRRRQSTTISHGPHRRHQEDGKMRRKSLPSPPQQLLPPFAAAPANLPPPGGGLLASGCLGGAPSPCRHTPQESTPRTPTQASPTFGPAKQNKKTRSGRRRNSRSP